MMDDIQPAEWDKAAIEYARNCNPFSALHAFDLLTALLPVINTAPTCNFLDVGSGAGALALAYLRLFPSGVDGHHFTSIDISSGMVEQARRAVDEVKHETCKTTFDFHVDDGTTLETMADDSVNIVVSAFAIFLIPDREAVMRQVSRVLKKGGVLGMNAWTAIPPMTEGFGKSFEDVIWGSAQFLTPPLKEPTEAPKPDDAGDSPWEQWRDIEKAKKILSGAQFQNISAWKTLHTASFPNMSHIWRMIVSSPMADCSQFSEEELESAFQKFRAFVAGDDEIGDEQMILLVNASNIFIAHTN